MSRKTWTRRSATWQELVTAAGAAAGVGGLVFWLVRLLLARDEVGRRGPPDEATGVERGEGAAP